ncbi:MAG: 30S ribosome-binding factor RbfA [Eubacteriales bacterium]|nr:30S ribosome-binding factor RbfA [Eubacteriales bacterium]
MAAQKKHYRQGRLGEEIKKLISDMLLKDIKDPRLEGIISISDVEVTRDNSYATCYVMILDMTGDEEEKAQREEDVLDGFYSVKGLIRKEIGAKMKLHHAPDLIFKIDRSMEYGEHIDSVLAQLKLEEEDNED